MSDRRKYLIPSLAIFIVFSVFVLPSLTVSQTSSTTSRDALLQQIRADADRHVKAGAPMQTQVILDLYRNNEAGVTLPELAHTYEEEYVKQKEAAKPSQWDELKPKIAWIVVAIMALALIFYKVLEKWFSSLIEMFGERLWNRLAASRFFKNIALQRYQKALSERYSELRIPFSSRPLKMSEVYVPLKVTGASDSEQLEAFQAIVKYRRLMIVGPPGSGKSMLLKNLAFQYAQGRMTALSDRPVPILLELHYLGEKPDLTLEQHLAMALARNRFSHAERFVSQNLTRGTLMLLLDGLDEVNSTERAQVVNKIRDFLDEQRECRVVITCRNAVYQGEFIDRVDQTLEIVEFSDQQVQNFLSSWEPYMQDDKSVEQLMHTLHDRPRIMALARNPLLLTIIAYLYTDTPNVLPHSRAEFYRQSTDVLLRQWHQERNRYEARDKQAVLQRLALHFMDSTAERQQDRRSLDFQAVLDQVGILLPKLNLRQDSDVRPLINEIVERSGLLLSIDGGQRYQFAHLTLQEYFAAAELADDADGLMRRFLADQNPWRETVKLWCGLGVNSTALIEKVYGADPITAFECLADATVVDQNVSARILNDFYQQLGTKGDNATAIARAFGAVAADLRPRGAAVFDFLKNVLTTHAETSWRVAAAEALALTNQTEAAKALADHYHEGPEIRAALVRMGDLAVPALESLAEAGNLTVLEDLEAIATPQAAQVLVGLLWHDNNLLCYGAAWRLASLLLQSNIEDALRRYPLTSQQRAAAQMDWVWRPFGEVATSSLPTITGRIALLVNTAPMETAPLTLQKLDPRIVVPLFLEGKPLQFIFVGLRATPLIIETASKLLGYKVSSGTVSAWGPRVLFEVRDDPGQVSTGVQALIDLAFDSGRMPSRAKYLLTRINRDIQIKVLSNRELLNSFTDRSPQTDWSNLFRPVTYDIDTAWHYRVIAAFLWGLSAFAAWEIVLIIYHSPALLTWKNVLFLLELVGLVIAPFTFLEGSSSVELWGRKPGELLRFGLFGLVMAPFTIVMNVAGYHRARFSRFDSDDFIECIQLLACGAWLPATLYFTTPRLLLHFSSTFVIAAWVSLILISAVLAIRGSRLDRDAANPLQGILDRAQAS